MIKQTKTGLKHSAREGWFYTGEIAETGIVPQAKKRGRGRPRKDEQAFAASDFSALTSAFGMTAPKEYNGPSQVFLKVDINGDDE